MRISDEEQDRIDDEEKRQRKYKELDEEREDQEDLSFFNNNIPYNQIEYENNLIQNEWGEPNAINEGIKQNYEYVFTSGVIPKGSVYVDPTTEESVVAERPIQIKGSMNLWELQAPFLAKEVALSFYDKDARAEVEWSNPLGYDCAYARCPKAAALLNFITANVSQVSQGFRGKLRENTRERRIIKRSSEERHRNAGMNVFNSKKEF